MDKPSTLFTGIFGAFIVSCGTMVLLPDNEIGSLNPVTPDWDGSQLSVTSVYPLDRRFLGRGQYVADGCFYCHTQQVRDAQYGQDMVRGWGVRRTVARDYIYEDVPLLGAMRLGPDFANYSSASWRNEPADDPKRPAKRDAAWIYKHLFNPNSIVKEGSLCPPRKDLFDRVEIAGAPSPNAAHVDGKYEWIPKAEARNLAAYLLGQDRSHPLAEAPTMITPKEEKK